MSKVQLVEAPSLWWNRGSAPDLQSTWRLIVGGDVAGSDGRVVGGVGVLGVLPREPDQDSASGVKLGSSPLSPRFWGAVDGATDLNDVPRVLDLDVEAFDEALSQLGAKVLGDRRCKFDPRGEGVDESEENRLVQLRLSTLSRHLEVGREPKRDRHFLSEIQWDGRCVDALVVW